MNTKRALVLIVAATSASCALPSVASELRASSGGYSVEIVDQNGQTLPTFESRGRTYVLGDKGDRYQIRVHNLTGRRVEAVLSVDGRDVLDGKPANWHKGGYLIPARGEVTVDGFRLNMGSVATFRFSDVRGSYAAKMGDARDVGVIGVAIFPELYVPLPPPRRVYRDYDDGSLDGMQSRAPAGKSGSYNAEKDVKTSQPKFERQAAAEDAAPAERPGLGTAFGEQRYSRVTTVSFQRQSSRPSQLLAIRYNDHDGLVALGVDVDHLSCEGSHELVRRETARPFTNLPPRFSTPPPGWTPEDP